MSANRAYRDKAMLRDCERMNRGLRGDLELSHKALEKASGEINAWRTRWREDFDAARAASQRAAQLEADLQRVAGERDRYRLEARNLRGELALVKAQRDAASDQARAAQVQLNRLPRWMLTAAGVLERLRAAWSVEILR